MAPGRASNVELRGLTDHVGCHSRGDWEGNTLVAETTNFHDRTRFEGSSKDMLLVERWTRVSDDEIDYGSPSTIPPPGLVCGLRRLIGIKAALRTNPRVTRTTSASTVSCRRRAPTSRKPRRIISNKQVDTTGRGRAAAPRFGHPVAASTGVEAWNLPGRCARHRTPGPHPTGVRLYLQPRGP
jgi:hypothetical protein